MHLTFQEEIMDDFYKDWYKIDRHKVCSKCGGELEAVTNSSWWTYFLKCKECDRLFEYNYGDKMGGQADSIWTASEQDLKDALEGEYGEQYRL